MNLDRMYNPNMLARRGPARFQEPVNVSLPHGTPHAVSQPPVAVNTGIVPPQLPTGGGMPAVPVQGNPMLPPQVLPPTVAPGRESSLWGNRLASAWMLGRPGF